MIRRPPRSTQGVSSAASDVYKRQKSSTQMYLDNAWDKWHDLQLEGWTFEELESPESL